MLQDLENNFYSYQSPYEAFIKQHLQHYGFYTKKTRRRSGDVDSFPQFYEDSSDEDNSITEEVKYKEKKIEALSLRTTQLIQDEQENGSLISRLKAPIQQDFNINFDQKPRWPIELDVLSDSITFNRTLPDKPEPLYKPTGKELQPKTYGEEDGQLVYENKIYPTPFFMRSKSGCCTNSSTLPNIAVDFQSDKDDTLLFESRFESANLEKVYKLGSREYELHLRPDLYTNKHTQWYFFRVSNTRSDSSRSYRLTIVNLYKSDSLYNYGLRPLMYSMIDAEKHGKGWHRCGENITYYRNNRRYETSKGTKSYYSLTWTMEFPHDHDTVYFAHCYPYTYTDMMKYVCSVTQDPVKSKYCHVKLLTRTLANNATPLLTITNPTESPDIERKKKVVVLTGRVHPGESNASWMMEGLLDFLLDDKPDSQLLRDLFIFKVVPMLNPDGVIVGNYRCSLTGRDLNRNYLSNLKSSYPVIWRLKNMIESIQQERGVYLYCDFHGHSRRQNVFLYGNGDQKLERDFLMERALSMLINKHAPDKFSYNYCRFKVQKSKAGASRIAFHNIGIPLSFTIEASFCGSDLLLDNKSIVNDKKSPNINKIQPRHFSTLDLNMIGDAFCNSLLDYVDPDDSQLQKIMNQIKNQLTSKYINNLQERGVNVSSISANSINITSLDESDLDSSDNEDDNGSDSSDSNGLPVDLDYVQQKLKFTKSKKTKVTKKFEKASPVNKENPFPIVRCLSCLHAIKANSKPTLASTSQLNKTTNKPASLKSTPPQSKPLSLETKIYQKSKRKSSLKSTGSSSKLITVNTPPVDTKTTDIVLRRNSETSQSDPSGKNQTQEVETKKVLLRYTGKKATFQSQEIRSSPIQNYSNNSTTDTQYFKPKPLIRHERPPIDSSNLIANKLSGSSHTNSFQVIHFSPQNDLDPRHKNFNSFYRNHTDLNKRAQVVSNSTKKSGQKDSNTPLSSLSSSSINGINKNNSSAKLNVTFTSIK